jgi:hypothetical protein
MELGKDIISRDKDGILCAFQLKGIFGKRMTQSEYRDDLANQIWPLATCPIVHPSVPPNASHRSYIVVNGDFNEEVQYEIAGIKSKLQSINCELETIVKGELLEKFKKLGTDLWSTTLEDDRLLLEVYLDAGNGSLHKDKLSILLCAVLQIQNSTDAPNPNTVSRSIASAAILCSLIASQFAEFDDHNSEFEVWTLYFSHVLAAAEAFGLPEKYWQNETKLATSAMVGALMRLCDELSAKDNLFNSDPLIDRAFLEVRKTQLLGLVGLAGLYLTAKDSPVFGASNETDRENIEKFVRTFCLADNVMFTLWGEACLPSVLSFYLYRRNIDGTLHPAVILRSAIRAILTLNKPNSKNPLPSPYYSLEEVGPKYFGVDETPIDDVFAGSSYTLEGLLHLYARLLWKQDLKSFWHEITHIKFLSFHPEPPWGFYLWRSERGYNETKVPFKTKRWEDLKSEAADDSGNTLPRIVRDYPWHYLAMIMVMPHRWSSPGVRWLATKLRK